MSEGGKYVHGTEPEEQARLTRLNTLLNDGSLKELRPSAGERMIDVGAGLGQFARAVSKITGTRTIGVERSAEQIERGTAEMRAVGEEHLLELRRGDAMDLPLEDDEWARFDIAHARFLLEHVPRPLEVVRAMVRAVRPGGRVVLEDDDHDLLRLWPEPPGFSAVWHAYMRAYDRVGNDPYVGRRLVQLLHEAGANPRRCTWIFFGACAGDPTFDIYVENLAIIIEQARSKITESGIRSADVDAVVSILRTWKLRPDAAIWFAMSWAEGVRPA